MLRECKQAVLLLAALSVLTGIVYPLAMTGIAQVAFPRQANGSLIREEGRVVASALIGQRFTDPKYFWGRRSATSPRPYNAAASAGSNLGPNNPVLVDAVRQRIAALRAADPGNPAPVPVDLVTASASGLDPHISVAAAAYQAGRVARTRGLSPTLIQQYISRHTEGRTWGLLGEPRVNVIELNLELDRNEGRTSRPGEASQRQ